MAAELGMTVQQLTTSMSASELYEWLAYYKILDSEEKNRVGNNK